MSVATPLLAPELAKVLPSRIWISPVDPEGNPVDPKIRDAAYRKEAALFRYRRDVLPDDARVAELIEETVYRVSKFAQTTEIRNAPGFLYNSYKKRVLDELARRVREIRKPARALELVVGTSDPESQILVNIEGRRLLEAMDPDSRSAWELRLLGFQVQEIAVEFEVSADCLSTRLRRGVKQALKRLGGDEPR